MILVDILLEILLDPERHNEIFPMLHSDVVNSDRCLLYKTFNLELGKLIQGAFLIANFVLTICKSDVDIIDFRNMVSAGTSASNPF